MQSILAVVALILAIAHPTEAKAAGHVVSAGQHTAGFGMPRLPHVPRPHWP